jgi:hypothetical protein
MSFIGVKVAVLLQWEILTTVVGHLAPTSKLEDDVKSNAEEPSQGSATITGDEWSSTGTNHTYAEHYDNAVFNPTGDLFLDQNGNCHLTVAGRANRMAALQESGEYRQVVEYPELPAMEEDRSGVVSAPSASLQGPSNIQRRITPPSGLGQTSAAGNLVREGRMRKSRGRWALQRGYTSNQVVMFMDSVISWGLFGIG